MKETSKYQPGMSFYMQMPDSYMVVLNSDHPLIKRVLDETDKATADALKPVEAELRGQEARLAAINQSQSGKKDEEISQEEKDDEEPIFISVTAEDGEELTLEFVSVFEVNGQEYRAFFPAETEEEE